MSEGPSSRTLPTRRSTSCIASDSATARELSLAKDARALFDIERDDVIGVGTLDDRPFTAIDPHPVIRRLLD